MIRTREARHADAPRRPTRLWIEAVESRVMMSVAGTMSPGAVYLTPAASLNTTVQGYTPAQIRKAYGFDDVSFSNGTVAANGAGQTIAIVDAYNDPNIRADLAVFDAQFGLAAPPSFNIVNQTGGTNLPATDASWAGEIALDVEWAHAIAPAANILLVLASSDSTADLMTAVNYARSAPNVSVVSMSWGGSEYVSWGGGGESTTQTSYDVDFTTPTGHRSVTFVAAAGDSGQSSGVQWPASSPNVLSVGGTALTLAADGTYVSETGWAGTSSGSSSVEPEPTYQQAVQSTGARTVADVAYNGDPNTGFAVYDSLADGSGSVGWQVVGGTSAGAPQWAALIAIANQGRVIAGVGTLDGVGQTLPALYSLYAAPTSAGYANYTGYFNDVTSGGAGTVGFGHGGRGSNTTNAKAGYDVVTGLGTPKADAIIGKLATAAAVSGSTGTGSGGNNASTTSLSNVAVTVVSNPPAAVVGGTAGAIRVRLANTGSATFAGPVTVTLYQSTDSTAADGTALTAVTFKALKLRAGTAKVITVKFKYSATLATDEYFLVASADATATSADPTSAASTGVTVTAPFADLSVAFANDAAVAVTSGKKAKATVRVTNVGNVTTTGTATLTLTAVSTADGSVQPLATLTRKVKLGAHKALSLKLPFTAPADLTPGSYTIVATVTSATTPADTNTDNDTATTATA